MLEQHLVILLVKLAVAAALASILARSSAFKRLLLREERTLNQRLHLALSFGLVYGLGAATRIVTRGNYQAVDLAFEAALVAGLCGGYVTGLVSGVLVSIPGMVHGEYLSMAAFAGIGVVGGLLRDLAPDPAEIWKFTPFLDLSLYRVFRGRGNRGTAAYHLFLVFAVLLAEVLRAALSAVFGRNMIFSLRPEEGAQWGDYAAGYVATLFAVALPIKVWNSARNEVQLESQRRLLTDARLEALSYQINPHFLFNTLNSVSSLIRTNPAEARAVVLKLSRILRRLLRKHDNFSPLREELAFIDDYLSIEVVRFGEKLRFTKDIHPETLDRLVPTMLLQPLVENSIKHGLSGKVEGGMIRIRSWLAGDRLMVAVEDDGVGIPEAVLATLFERGIGVSNVNRRLKVLYGDGYRMWIDSKPGEGTKTEIELPGARAGVAAVS